MREILFRGKRTDNSEWIDGSVAKSGGTFMICDYGLTYGYFEVFEIFPETVGQFTGLTDKNSKRIFEGDIVKYCDPNNRIFYGVVRYGEHSGGQ